MRLLELLLFCVLIVMFLRFVRIRHEKLLLPLLADKHSGRQKANTQTDRQTDRRTDRQAGKRTGRRAGGQADRQTHCWVWVRA